MYVQLEMNKGTVEANAIYNNDERDLKKQGEKVQSPPMLFNTTPSKNQIHEIDQAGKHVSAQNNTWMRLLISHPSGVILSPRQHRWVVDKLLKELAPLCTITKPPGAKFVEMNENLTKAEKRKRRRMRQAERSMPFNPLKLVGRAMIHDTTDNPHNHGNWSLVDPGTGNVVSFNGGKWKLAAAYAKQCVERAMGEDVPELLILDVVNGQIRVKIDTDVQQEIEAKKPPKTKAELELEKYQPPRKKKAAQVFRGRQDPALAFRDAVNLMYPDGPPLPPPPKPEIQIPDNIDRKLIYQGLTQHPEVQQILAPQNRWLEGVRQAREEFEDLLKRNNMCIRVNKYGGLVLCMAGDHVKLNKEVDSRWTRVAIEAFTRVKGEWTLGLPEKEQNRLKRGDKSYREWLATHSEPRKSEQDYNLPWSEAYVETKTMDGKTLRSRKTIDTALTEDYLLHVKGKKLTENGKKRIAACSLTVRPVCRPGEMLLCLDEIPSDRIEAFNLKYKPALVLKVGSNNYTAVIVLRYDVDQRWQARNSRAWIGYELMKESGAKRWSDGFFMPDVPLLAGPYWICPKVIGIPHNRVSEEAQALMPVAWEKLVAAEKQWWMRVTTIEEKQRGLNPGALTSKFIHNEYEPLRQCGSEKAVSIALTPQLVDKKADSKATDELDSKKKLAIQPISATAEKRRLDDEEELKKRKLKEQEEEKAAWLEAEQRQIREM